MSLSIQHPAASRALQPSPRKAFAIHSPMVIEALVTLVFACLTLLLLILTGCGSAGQAGGPIKASTPPSVTAHAG